MNYDYIGLLLFLSASLNLHFFFTLRRKNALNLAEKVHEAEQLEIHKKLVQEQSGKKVLSIDAQQIIHDMTGKGQAIVRIIPINPSDVFWRSPR